MSSAARSRSSPWSYAVRGLIGVVFGAFMLLSPGITLETFVLACGLFFLADGAVAALTSFLWTRDRRMDWALLAGGLVSLGVGLLFLFRPLLSVAVLSLLISAWMMLVGVSTIVSAVRHRREIRGEWTLIVAGLFPLVFGIYLLVQPTIGATMLPLMIGGYAVFWGLLLLGSAVRLWWRGRSAPDGSVATS